MQFLFHSNTAPLSLNIVEKYWRHRNHYVINIRSKYTRDVSLLLKKKIRVYEYTVIFNTDIICRFTPKMDNVSLLIICHDKNEIVFFCMNS